MSNYTNGWKITFLLMLAIAYSGGTLAILEMATKHQDVFCQEGCEGAY